MASTFLKCSICPRQPDFSDTSHLLTHISSKGHLAHLHKLQVRSHQEVAAGQQLAAYDIWYQQYELGQLLSERLQQKDAKKAPARTKRGKAASRRSLRSTATGNTTRSAAFSLQHDRMVSQEDNLRPYRPKLSGRSNHSHQTPEIIESDDESDFYSSPTRRLSSLRDVRTLKLATEQSLSDISESGGVIDDVESEASKLKGLIWPGMDIFDAATEEMRRKRNQKKDGSLLMRMERASELIDATETIYSPSGAMRKQRPITGNVDDDSPLKGETPIPKKRPARPKRTALAEESTNVPASRRHSNRATRSSISTTKTTFPYLPSSSVDSPYDCAAHYAPIEDEKAELNLTFGYLAAPKRNFAIFKENEPSPADIQRSTHLPSSSAAVYNHDRYSRAETYISSAPGHLSQQSQANSYGWPLPAAGLGQTNGDSGKENVDPRLRSMLPTSEFHQNPLGWTGSIIGSQIKQPTIERSYQNWIQGLQSMPAGYSANPLNLAFQELQNQATDPFTEVKHGFEGHNDMKSSLVFPAGLNSEEEEGTTLPKGFFGDERT